MPNDAEFMHQMNTSIPNSRLSNMLSEYVRQEINRLAAGQQIVYTMPGNGATIVVDRTMYHANV